MVVYTDMKQGTVTIRLEFYRLSSSRNGPNYYGPKLFNILPTND